MNDTKGSMNNTEGSMNNTANLHYKQFGRNKFKYKYLLTCGDIKKKYCSIVDMINDPILHHLNLNRQMLYRIRKKHYSIRTDTNSYALIKKGFNKINIISINETRKSRTIKVLV